MYPSDRSYTSYWLVITDQSESSILGCTCTVALFGLSMQIKLYEEEYLQDQLPWYFYTFFICQKIVFDVTIRQLHVITLRCFIGKGEYMISVNKKNLKTKQDGEEPWCAYVHLCHDGNKVSSRNLKIIAYLNIIDPQGKNITKLWSKNLIQQLKPFVDPQDLCDQCHECKNYSNTHHNIHSQHYSHIDTLSGQGWKGEIKFTSQHFERNLSIKIPK